MKKILIATLLLLPAVFYAGGLYGPIAEKRYLTGKFSPRKHPFFVNVHNYGFETYKRTIFIRKEVAQALQKAQKALKKDHPDLSFIVLSGTRTYWQQKFIWQRKWKRYKASTPLKKALKILVFSSMPGTSRHHWGTDVDLNSLNNKYFSYGKGLILYKWMKKNMHKFGFYLVYTAGRKQGYNEERWHWTYLPTSKKLLKDWNKNFYNYPLRINEGGGFYGSHISSIIKLAPIYATAINPKCK